MHKVHSLAATLRGPQQLCSMSARMIRINSLRISDRNFRKLFAAAKFFVRNRARSPRNACRIMTRSLAATLTGPQQLCSASAREIIVGSQRISDRNFRNFFAAAKFFVQNRARSPRNACRIMSLTRSLAATLRGPQQLCSASAREIWVGSQRISDRIFENSSRPQNFRSELREIAPKSLPHHDAQPRRDP